MRPDQSPAPTTVGYAELSRRYAEEDRIRDAALAQWAADLQVIGPLLDHRASELPSTQAVVEVESHREAVTAARDLALQLVARASQAQAVFTSVQHLPEHAVEDPATAATRRQDTPTELLERAVDLMAQARALAGTDLEEARACALEADLASFEALLLESAHRYGDPARASVRLRLDIAAASLTPYGADPLTSLAESLAESVERTRRVLRAVVEPHELETLQYSFARAVAS